MPLPTQELTAPREPSTVEGETPSIKDVLMRFQSIGDNCEFGLVQRYCDCEPLGLFRFTYSSVSQLIAAVSADFEGYGAPGDLDLVQGPGNYHWCKSRRYEFAHSTNHTIGTVDPGELLARENKKIAYLKRAMLEELAEGHKIFVHKGRPSETLDEFLALAAAIRRHGPPIVLRVEPAPSPDRIGDVHWHSPGIMQGYVRRFSPYEGGMDIDLEPWVELCRNAYCLAEGIPRPAVPGYGEFFQIRAAGKAVRHLTRHQEMGLSGFSAEVDRREVAFGAINVFAAWIWIPKEFQGDRIHAYIKVSDVYQCLAHLDADLSVRDAWQRVWISAQLPAQSSKVTVGVAALALGRQPFWSTDWRISRDPFPPYAPTPTLTVQRGFWEQFFG